MKNELLTLVILLAILLPEVTFSQKNYTVTNFNGDNGLPQNSVKWMFSDSEGFLWLATEDGLVRYDGRKFYIFNRKSLGVSNVRIGTAMPADKPVSGRSKKSYVIFSGGETVRVENGKASIDSVFDEDKNKNMFAIKETKAIYRETFLPEPISLSQYPNDNNYHLFQAGDTEHNYLCDSNSVSFFLNRKRQYTIPYRGTPVREFFTMGGNLYHQKSNGDIMGFSMGKPVEMTVSGDIENEPGYKEKKQRVIVYWNSLSDQTFLYINKNLYWLNEIRDRAGHVHLVTRLLVENFDIASKLIRAIYFDNYNQKVFMGSPTQGLFILSKQSFEVLKNKGDERRNVFYGEMPYKDYAVSTPNGMIFGKNPLTGAVVTEQLTLLATVNQWDGKTIMRDANASIWVKDGRSLIHLDRTDKIILGRWELDEEIQTLHQGKMKKIWFGVLKKGLCHIDPNDLNARPQLFIKGSLEQINYIESLSSDRLLLGTTTGLYQVDITDKKLKLIPGTQGFNIQSIHGFGAHQAWVTAHEKGLMLLDSTGFLTVFPMDKNSYLSSPHCVVDDERGYLWIPTNRGLFQMSVRDLLQYSALNKASKLNMDPTGIRNRVPAELFYAYHTKDEGFNTNEFNGGCQPCGLKLQNGYISLPSLNGFVWFRPDQIKNSFPKEQILLDKVEIARKLLSFSGDTLIFPQNPRQINLHFSTAYLGNPYNVNFSYALVKENTLPMPSDWLPIDNDESDIRFSVLSSGDYVLMIRKLNGFGVDNYTIKKLFIVVPLLWYEQWWAKAFAVLILIAFVYLYNIFKVKRIKKENLRLEEVVRNRTKKLNKVVWKLEESTKDMNRQMHIMSRLMASITHDIQSPLNHVGIASAGIPKMLEQGRLGDVSELGSIIADSTKRMNSMLSDLLSYIKIQVFGNRMKFEEFNLKVLCDHKILLFNNLIKENNSRIVNEIPEQVMVFTDYQMLSVIIHNLIDNAAKFTKNGEIVISTCKEEGKSLELTISNDSSGIPADLMDMINAEEYEGTMDQIPRKKSGMGLLIVKDLTILLGIGLSVEQDVRTKFHLRFE
ncbi:sensor histidine kinase [Dyadobacter frigoris]|uniref:histidine kinase n=1 Tax=Dyadobacter frigoris TaxID=2576211 RepID=A0A4U6CVK9_9BACT|nr:HAMP domain-containing sensor histidine kinase [Dyadobacter frigoris]TKT88800.1 hypothetical protein FDK13_26230 [Dyadobacter frigoris]GLU53997.1 hypothetical protein Dfri01_34580 [Dyadobacter frigoris]